MAPKNAAAPAAKPESEVSKKPEAPKADGKADPKAETVKNAKPDTDTTKAKAEKEDGKADPKAETVKNAKPDTDTTKAKAEKANGKAGKGTTVKVSPRKVSKSVRDEYKYGMNAGDDIKRADHFLVDPFEVLVKEDVRGRVRPPTEEKIIQMAESLDEFGQRTPVEVRKVDENRLQVNFGFTRTAAARLLRKGFVGTDGQEHHDPEFMLKVTVVTKGDDKTAFIHNIVENAHRNETSPIDDAMNQDRLRDRYGYTDAQITKLYRYNDPNKVGRLKRLLSLTPEIQDLVHNGSMGVQSALDLLDMPAEKRAEVVKTSTSETTGKVSGASIRSQVRDRVLNDDNHTPTPGAPRQQPRFKPLSMRDVKTFFEELSERATQQPIKSFAETFLKWLAGQRRNETMAKSITDLYDA